MYYDLLFAMPIIFCISFVPEMFTLSEVHPALRYLIVENLGLLLSSFISLQNNLRVSYKNYVAIQNFQRKYVLMK